MAQPITEQDRSQVRDALTRLITKVEIHRGQKSDEQLNRKQAMAWEGKCFQSCHESRAKYVEKYNAKRQTMEAKLKTNAPQAGAAAAAAQQPPSQAQPQIRPAPQQVPPKPTPLPQQPLKLMPQQQPSKLTLPLQQPPKPTPPFQQLPKPMPPPQQPPKPLPPPQQVPPKPMPQPQQVPPKPLPPLQPLQFFPPQQAPPKPMPPPQQPQTRTLPAPALFPPLVNPRETSLLARTAMLTSKNDGEKTRTLDELGETLDPSNLQANKTRSQTVLNNKAAMDALLTLVATTSSADVAAKALWVLARLARDNDNAGRLFQEHPSVIPAAMRNLELGSATEGVQMRALGVLQHLANNLDNAREMASKNPALVPLVLGKVESKSEQIHVRALGVLRNLTVHVDNKREMFTKNPELVPQLVAKVGFYSEQVQVNALGVLQNLTVNVDNAREMVSEDPTLVPLLIAKMGSNLEQVQVKALGVLQGLAVNIDNQREMATNNPTLVSLVLAKVESNSEQVQVGALIVLSNLAFNDDNAREMVTRYPTLVSQLVAKVGSNSEPMQLKALNVLHNLAVNVNNAREMVTKNPSLVCLLVAEVEFNSKKVQAGALEVLHGLAGNADNAREMVTENPALVPLLATKMSASTALDAIKVVYQLSCSPDNRTVLCGNDSVVAALTKGREDGDEDTRFVSFLALVNLFGAEGDSEVLKTDLAMLQRTFDLVVRVANKSKWKLNAPLLAFRCLCVVERNRQLLWNEYGKEFLATILAALQQAIDNKDAPTAENAVFTLVQFSNDPEPLAWMHSNKPQLDEVIAQLAPFPEAQRTAQALVLALDPPDTKASVKRVLSDDVPTKRQQVVFNKTRIPQNEQEIRQWLAAFEDGSRIADTLIEEELVNANGLKRLAKKKSTTELKTLLELNANQALLLEDALKEIF